MPLSIYHVQNKKYIHAYTNYICPSLAHFFVIQKSYRLHKSVSQATPQNKAGICDQNSKPGQQGGPDPIIAKMITQA